MYVFVILLLSFVISCLISGFCIYVYLFLFFICLLFFVFIFIFYFSLDLFFAVFIWYLNLSHNFYCHEINILSNWICPLDWFTWICLGSKCWKYCIMCKSIVASEDSEDSYNSNGNRYNGNSYSGSR